MRPQFSPCGFMLLYGLVAAVLLSLGIAVLITSSKVVEYTESYSDCTTPVCTVTFDVSEEMEDPVFLYYEVTNMYKNHRLFVKSKDDKQLAGESRSRTELEEYCDDMLEVGDLWLEVDPNSTALANPCGLIANSLFNDTYSFSSHSVKILKTGISWTEDEERYERFSDDWRKTQWTDVEKGIAMQSPSACGCAPQPPATIRSCMGGSSRHCPRACTP